MILSFMLSTCFGDAATARQQMELRKNQTTERRKQEDAAIEKYEQEARAIVDQMDATEKEMSQLTAKIENAHASIQEKTTAISDLKEKIKEEREKAKQFLFDIQNQEDALTKLKEDLALSQKTHEEATIAHGIVKTRSAKHEIEHKRLTEEHENHLATIRGHHK